MNFFLTLIAIAVTAIVLGGIAIFFMNILSMFIHPFMGKIPKKTPRYLIGLTLLTSLHSYIWLSLASILIILCFYCTTNSSIIFALLFLISGTAYIVMTWSAYFQAKNKLKDERVGVYESNHVIAVGINCMTSTAGFFILAFFPKVIPIVWPWIEDIKNLYL